ncbi:MAG: NAD(P)H-dependent oxidoreductase [Meiothermus sp.]|nr:NAD(P)H-dependent oxidoreductase [Meiothermus sp.]
MKILHIVCTPRGHASNTARISQVFLEALHERYDDLMVKTLDLFLEDLPAVAGKNIESKYALMTGQSLDGSQATSWKQIEKNIERFLDADLYLLTVPMWNLSIPYALKYYIDAIVQPGYLFRYNEAGVPEGLVKGKKMVCVTSSGGDYSGEYTRGLNFVEPYLRAIFGFVGITDMHFINAQTMDITPDLRKQSLKNAISDARALATGYEWKTSADVPPVPVASSSSPDQQGK